MIVHLDVSLYSIIDRKYDNIVIVSSMTIVGQEINETNISVDMESKLIIDLINNSIDSRNRNAISVHFNCSELFGISQY